MLKNILLTCAVWTLAATPPGSTAWAQCTPTPLVSGVAATVSTTPQHFSFNQSAGFWTGVAVRSEAGSDWNLTIFDSTAVEPACVAAPLDSSVQTNGVDLVVGDFNAGHNALGFHYPSVRRASGLGDATVEWDDGSHSLVVNGPFIERTVGAADVIEVWDVFLPAGAVYRFTFDPQGADLRLLLFKSGAGPYWAGRAGAEFDVSTDTDYPCIESGYYGVAVISEDGMPGSFSLRVGTCVPPVALESGVSVSSAGFAERYYSCDQDQIFWTGVAARGASDWNVGLYLIEGGAGYPTCLSDSLVASTLPAPTVDIALRNYNKMLVETFYARVYMDQGIGSGSARIEWDSGADFIEVDGTPVSRDTDPSDVFEVWDIYLDSGTTYYILFPTTGADLRLLLFPPNLMSAGRGDAILERTGNSAYVPYVATQTGWHGLVVVNENGGTGTYGLHVSLSTVGLEEAAGAPGTSLLGIFPNPARAAARIEFTLSEAGAVSLDVLDVTGRMVSGVPSTHRSAGRWSIPWRGIDARGGRLAPGIYFLRMKVGERRVGLRKFILLD